ncbi:MAG: ABC transporter substrate-binding protein, partial [Anaerotignum sp.]|nr:ABC transporter substrate-binding protein [Anaerotignum sp.]
MKKLFAMLLTAVLAFGAVGCGGSEPAAENNDLEDFSIVLDWYPNAIHSFLYVAQEKGYFAEEGLNLVVNFPANTNDGISLPAAGKADLGMYYLQDAILTAVEEDVPIVSVGAVAQESLNVVISLKESGIDGAEDLEGKKIGYAGTVLSEEQIKSMLEHVGLEADSCEFVDVGFDLLTATTTGQVDATIGNMVNHEVPQLEEEGIEINYFFPTDFGVPEVYELVFLAGQDAVDNNPEKLQKFLRAAKKGFEFTKENPEEALQILLDNQ